MEQPRPNFPATPEEISVLDAALERTNGVRVHAAQALGWDVKRVHNMIGLSPHLRAKWLNKNAEPVQPGPDTDLHRPPALEPFTPSEKKVVDALNLEDASLQKGWKRLNFKPEERKFLAGLQASYAGNLKSTMDLAYGGAAHANTRLLLALEDLKEKLEDIKANPDNYRRSFMTEHGERESKGPDEYYAEYYKLFVSVSAELRKMGDSVTKANELRLRMEKLRVTQLTKVRSEAGWDTAKKVDAA
jgi:hypothetical protein